MAKLPIFIPLLAGTVFARNVKNDPVHLDYITYIDEQLINERGAIYDFEYDPEVFDRIEVINDKIKTLKKLKKISAHNRPTAKGKKRYNIQQARDSIINDLIEDLKFMKQDSVNQYSDSQVVDQSNKNQGGGQVTQSNQNSGGKPVTQTNTNNDSQVDQQNKNQGGGQVTQSNQNSGGTPLTQTNTNNDKNQRRLDDY